MRATISPLPPNMIYSLIKNYNRAMKRKLHFNVWSDTGIIMQGKSTP